jgi:hypothetical protein
MFYKTYEIVEAGERIGRMEIDLLAIASRSTQVMAAGINPQETP